MKNGPFIELYSVPQDEPDRWIAGDIHLRRLLRKLLRPFRNAGANGLARVGINLSLGLTRLQIPHRLHSKYVRPRPGARVGILHAPIRIAKNIACEHRCVIGPGVLNMPEEWPNMFSGTKAQTYLQACEWQGDVFRRVFHDRVKIWPVGIDTDAVAPSPSDVKTFDFLVYDKRRWPNKEPARGILEPVLARLERKKLSWRVLRYGQYPKPGKKGESVLHEMARQAKAMLFLCENETQGIAYNEVLSLDVPILAWDQGFWQDPVREKYGLKKVPATSVPYWDERCGLTFKGPEEFESTLEKFLQLLSRHQFQPRQYVLENLGLKKKTLEYLALLESGGS
jgi:hypothetical protein